MRFLAAAENFFLLRMGTSGVAADSNGATGQHGTEFCDLGVDLAFLLLESCYGSDDDFGGELCRHVILQRSYHLR
jgi:hypothetical protein